MASIPAVALGALAFLSLLLTLWQWFAGRRFPLPRACPVTGPLPPITILKPLKGSDAYTAACLTSWLRQEYSAPVQFLFGVADGHDPVCELVRGLIAQHPEADAELVFCPEDLGLNPKVSTLRQLEPCCRHEVLLLSDADTWVPAGFLASAVRPLHRSDVGLVHCFYRLANPTNLAMHWEAIVVNVDFWSQVLQSEGLKPIDFALGAAIAVRRSDVAAVGGFAALADYLADDYQLGQRMVRAGKRTVLCPSVVDCFEPPQTWGQVARHQLRWARTIRVCQPVAYFLSLLSNPTLWPLSFLAAAAAFPGSWFLVLVCVGVRLFAAHDLQRRFLSPNAPRSPLWLVPIKDLLQVAIWFGAFLGRTIEWRGRRFRVGSDGKLVDVGVHSSAT